MDEFPYARTVGSVLRLTCAVGLLDDKEREVFLEFNRIANP